MSSALALSGVTAVMQYCLNSVLNSPTSVFGSVSVTAVAPDIVQAGIGGGTSAGLQVNVFLHQVTPSAAWRNVDLPSLGSDGSARQSDQPLALDLHYLLTAYASDDTMAEALLGYALLMLHENPVLPRALITTALNNVPGTNPLSTSLGSSGLAEQIEMIKITPATLGKEEMAWLWTALKADYRPTFPFQVSVVLIQRELASSSALPVLSRNIVVKPGPPAQLTSIEPASAQFGFAPGDTVKVNGVSLSDATQIILANAKLGVSATLAPSQSADDSISFVIPDAPTSFPAGHYSLSVRVIDSTGVVVQSSNALALPVSPVILLPATVSANADGTLVTVNCKPNVLPTQSASLAMGGTAVPALPFATAAATLSFQFPVLPSNTYLARLRVDGVDSLIIVDWTASPPAFLGPMITV